MSKSTLDPIAPVLSDAQWQRLIGYGRAVDAEPGEVLFRAGDRWYDLVAVESGEVEIVRDPLPWFDELRIGEGGAGTLVGELGLLNGQRAFRTARVTAAGRMHRIDHAALQRLMAEDDELCDLLLRTLWARREALRNGPAALSLKLIGGSRSPGSHALRRYADRLELVYTWVDADDPEAAASLASHGFAPDDLPVAIVRGENVLRATPGRVAELLGLAYVNDDDTTADLAVVGGGPAGLAAAIYGASEGLRTVLLDSIAPGGQSASTSRIENYLGFPFGVSGDDLTGQACLQALKFGVRVFAPCEAARLDWSDDPLTLTLADGAEVRARSVIVTRSTARSTSSAGRVSRAPASSTRRRRSSCARCSAHRSWSWAGRTRRGRRRSSSRRTAAPCASSCAASGCRRRCRTTSSTGSPTTRASGCTRARGSRRCTATPCSSRSRSRATPRASSTAGGCSASSARSRRPTGCRSSIATRTASSARAPTCASAAGCGAGSAASHCRSRRACRGSSRRAMCAGVR